VRASLTKGKGTANCHAEVSRTGKAYFASYSARPEKLTLAVMPRECNR
jgi:hypothetical protein